MKERRNHIRLTAGGKVVIKREGGKTEEIEASLDNISFGGFGIFTKEKIEIGQIVDFELVMDLCCDKLSGKAKAKYIGEIDKFKGKFFNIGVEFIDTNENTIRYFISRLQAKSAKEMREKMRVKPIDYMPY